MKRLFLFLLFFLWGGFLFAQMECDIQIIPNDTVFYTNNDTTIVLSLSEEPNFLISWSESGEGLNVADSLHPTLFIPASSTNSIFVDATFLDGDNLINNGDFESGNTGFYSALQYVSSTGSQALWNEGTYTIGTNPHNYHQSWWNGTHDGNMYIGNGATSPGMVVYRTTINVQPYTDYVVKFEAANVDNGATSNNVARFQFSIDGQMVGDIFPLSTNVFEWNTYYQIWTSGNNSTSVITIVNQNTAGGGNDFAIDNIEVKQLCSAYDMVQIRSIATYYDTVEAQICEGESYEFRDTIFYENTLYNDTVSEENTINITTLNLTVNPKTIRNIEAQICRGESYTFFDTILSTPGTYSYFLQSENGCDSIINLQLDVKATFTDTIIAEICEGEVYHDNNFSETKTGVYTKEYMSIDGCPSSATLVLTVNPKYDIEYRVTAENEEGPFTEYGFYADSSGTYIQNLTTEKGCDSILTLYYVVDKPLLIYPYNAFMPMSDDENLNRFRICSNGEDVQVYKFQIYDRWGTLMYESNDIKEGWDGKYKGKYCPQGVYVYHVLYYSNLDSSYVKDYTGEFMLIY